MHAKHRVLIGMGIAVLLLPTLLALYYRNQAGHLEDKWSAAAAEVERLRAEAQPPSSSPGRVPGLMTSDASTDIEINTRPGSSRQESARESVRGIANSPPPAMGLPERSGDSERPRRRNADWMENLRTSDPQRYEEMQKRRQEMQQRVQDAWTQKTNYFMNRETSAMSDAELEEYTTMITLLEETWKLSQRMRADLSHDERHEVMSALRSNMVVLAPLIDNERNREYYDLATAMGHNEEEASAFVGYVNQITSNTSLRAILPGVMRGGAPGERPAFGDSPVSGAPPRQ